MTNVTTSGKNEANMTQAQQDYMNRVKRVSGEYTRAHRRVDDARRAYKKHPSQLLLDTYYKAIDDARRATEAYYS